MEDDEKKKRKKKGRRKEEKNGRQPKKKWKRNQSTKINLIGCDTIVNSPSYKLIVKKKLATSGRGKKVLIGSSNIQMQIF